MSNSEIFILLAIGVPFFYNTLGNIYSGSYTSMEGFNR